MTEIDKILTHSTLLDVKHVDFNKQYERAENNLETLKSLLKNNIKDKNVLGTINIYEEELKQMRQEAYDWMSQVGIKNHKAVRIVVLLEEIKDEE